MNYHGTVAYRTGTLGALVYEAFTVSLVESMRFLDRELAVRNRGNEEFFTLSYSPVYVMRGQSCILHESAHQISGGFRGDWFIMLDTDHVFAVDALSEMVSVFEGNNNLGERLDVLSGWIQKRQPPYTPCAYRYDFDPLKNPVPVNPADVGRHFLVPIDVAGSAALMVRRSVIERMKNELGERPFQPRWKYEGREDPESRNLYGDGPGGSDPFFWEDFSFFWRCKLLGIKCYLAPFIPFHHIETRIVAPPWMGGPAL